MDSTRPGGAAGMLERQRFWLRWTAPGPICDIRDGDTTVTIGHIRPVPPCGWLERWLGPRTLAACETPDDSLVFTLRRAGGPFGPPRWQVRDAQELPLGRVGPAPARSGQLGLLSNRFGRPFALIGFPGPDANCSVRAVDGRLLATVSWPPGGDGWLEVAAVLAEEPFAKMLLLTAVLWLAGSPAARPSGRSAAIRG